MKTRGVLGKRIVAIHQERQYNRELGVIVVSVEALRLDDGTLLIPITTEWVDGSSVDFRVVRPPRQETP